MSFRKRFVGSMFVAGCLAAQFGVPSAQAAPFPYDTIYVFGDSLSDIGNTFNLTGGQVPPPTRYSEGRFSNGPVWTQFLAEAAGVNLQTSQPFTPGQPGVIPFGPGQSVSFAYGGAATGISNQIPAGFPVPGVRGQVQMFGAALAGQGMMADPNALYIVWGGSNDYMLGITKNPRQPVNNLQTAVEQLYAFGARNFLIPNLPDLGKTPLGDEAGPPTRPIFSTRANAHNKLLENQLLRRLDRAHDDINLVPVDMKGLFDDILADPAALGFTSGVARGPAAGCLFPPFACGPVDATGQPLFWDELHPSSAAHWYMAQTALNALGVGMPRSATLASLVPGAGTPPGAGAPPSRAMAASVSQAAAVPTSGTVTLLGFGLLCVIAIVWRRPERMTANAA